MTVFILRHGESLASLDRSLFSRTDPVKVPLTEWGYEQTVAAGKALRQHYEASPELKNRKVRVVYSPFTRIVQSADGFLNGFGKEHCSVIQADPLLGERNHGDFDGLTPEQQQAKNPEAFALLTNGTQQQKYHTPMPNGESIASVQQRMQKFIDHAVKTTPADEDLVIISHGGNCRLLEQMLTHPPTTWLDFEHTPKYGQMLKITGTPENGKSETFFLPKQRSEIEPTFKTNAHTPVVDPAAQTQKNAPEIQKDKKKGGRSWGLWLFDVLLYPVVSNAVVFLISVGFTFLTQEGGRRKDNNGNLLPKDYTTQKAENGKAVSFTFTNPDTEEPKTYNAQDTKLVYGKFGQWMNQRGVRLEKFFTDTLNFSKNGASMGKMVFFSFLDGSLVAPLVKLVEDRREKIAFGLDKMMGTVPKDLSVYEAEPKQSWMSVLTGRLATVSIVVPTAVALSHLGHKNNKLIWNTEKENPGFVSLNDKIFNNPGEQAGKNIETKYPEAAATASKWITDIPYLFKTIYFEAFYTSVCTAGLYVSSRFLAGLGDKAKEKQSAALAKPPSTLPALHSVTLPPHQASDVTAAPSAASEKKHASDKLKNTAPNAAAENFSDRPLVNAEQASFVSA